MDAFLPANDMLDDQNPVAQNLDALLNKSQEQKRQRVMGEMAQAQLPQAAAPVMPGIPQPMPAPVQTVMPTLPAPAVYGAPAAPAGQPPADNWFVNGPGYMPGYQSVPAAAPAAAPAPAAPQPAMPGVGTLPYGLAPVPAAEPSPEEQQLTQSLIERNQAAMQINYGHMRVLQPTSDVAGRTGSNANFGNLPGSDGVAQAAVPDIPEPLAEEARTPDETAPASTSDTVTRQTDPAILKLANNDDLDVATLARQANREIQKSPDEVEIRLH